MESFEEISSLFEEIDELGTYDTISEDPTASVEAIPRQGNVYLRDIINPFETFSDEEFRRRYRFNKNTVINYITPPLQNGLQHHSMRGLPISLENQVLIALRFYATGSIQVVCADLHHVSQPTVSRIIKNVSARLAGLLSMYVKFPDNLQALSEAFETLPGSRYPGLKHIIGAIDCSHVRIKRPRGLNHTEAYRNRKGYFSINVQVIAGPNMEIFDIVARWPGSSHDSRIFRTSRIHAKLEAGDIQGILVGDSGYRAATYMLTPFVTTNSQAQIRYNYVQIRTRNVVERVFGVWKKRFACLQVGLATKLTTSTNIIVACAVLHNIAVNANDVYTEESINVTDMVEEPARNSPSGLAFRNYIVNQYYDY